MSRSIVEGFVVAAALTLAAGPVAAQEEAAAIAAAIEMQAEAAADAATPAETNAAAEAPVAAVPAPAVLPELDPDAYFKGQTGGTFGKNIVKVLPGNRRVAVGGFRVVFVVDNTITAQVRASYMPGRDTTGSASKTRVTLTGVDTATMQAITDQAYTTFLEQLRLAGREVVSVEQLQAFYAGLEPAASTPEAPYRKEVNLGYGKQIGLALAPTGVPLWWSSWDAPWSDVGPFNQTNIRRFGGYSKELDAIMIAPMIVVDFAQMTSSGNRSGLMARSAETGAELGVSVSGFASAVVRADETRNGLVTKGDDGSVRMTQAVGSEMPFAVLNEVAKSSNKGVVGAFAALGLNAGAVKGKSSNEAVTDNAQYSAAALDALNRATGAFARLFQKYPAD